MSTDARHAVFSFPRLSRKVNRDMWLDRFVHSMLMNQDGVLPSNTSWTVISPDNWPDEIDFIPSHFDLVAITSSDMELVESMYHQYRSYMAQEYGDYAELDIEEFLPDEMIFYTPDDEDRAYSDADMSAREALAPLYEEEEEDDDVNEEVTNDDDQP